MSSKLSDRGAWVVGGGTLAGLGVGFFFFERSVFWFLACLMLGIGAGLLIGALLPNRRG